MSNVVLLTIVPPLAREIVPPDHFSNPLFCSERVSRVTVPPVMSIVPVPMFVKAPVPFALPPFQLKVPELVIAPTPCRKVLVAE